MNNSAVALPACKSSMPSHTSGHDMTAVFLVLSNIQIELKGVKLSKIGPGGFACATRGGVCNA